MIEDKILIWKFKAGSLDALRRVYQKYKDDLLKLAVMLAGDVATAEDAVHDVFVKFAQSAKTIRINGNLKSYLSVCVANRIRNRYRDKSRRRQCSLESAENIATDTKSPHHRAQLNEQLQTLTAAMTKLPDDQREVVALYMQGDMTFKKIAELQNVSINTAQGRYRYGLKKLRKLINNEVTK